MANTAAINIDADIKDLTDSLKRCKHKQHDTRVGTIRQCTESEFSYY